MHRPGLSGLALSPAAGLSSEPQAVTASPALLLLAGGFRLRQLEFTVSVQLSGVPRTLLA